MQITRLLGYNQEKSIAEKPFRQYFVPPKIALITCLNGSLCISYASDVSSWSSIHLPGRTLTHDRHFPETRVSKQKLYVNISTDVLGKKGNLVEDHSHGSIRPHFLASDFDELWPGVCSRLLLAM